MPTPSARRAAVTCRSATTPQRCGVDEELIRAAIRRIAGADSVAVFEDLGIQQAPNSTLCSYLNKLLWILTGNFAKRGGQHLHSSFAPLFSSRRGRTHAGDGRPGDLGAGAVERCAARDPDRPSRPVPGDDRRKQQPRALGGRLGVAVKARSSHWSCMVVIDVAMTETARLAHYVLPAASSVREAGSDVLQSRVPAQHLPPSAPDTRAASGHAARARDLGAAGA